MNYWDLVKDAFWITLRNRYLWFFGFFAGVGGSSNFNSLAASLYALPATVAVVAALTMGLAGRVIRH